MRHGFPKTNFNAIFSLFRRSENVSVHRKSSPKFNINIFSDWKPQHFDLKLEKERLEFSQSNDILPQLIKSYF